MTICINRRVDAMVIAFQVEMTDPTKQTIRERAAVAAQGGGAAELLKVGKLIATMKRPSTRGAERWPIENADMRGLIEFHATAGWNLEVSLKASYLALHDVHDGIALARAIAESFGTVKATRLRRFDLAADFTCFDLNAEDAEGFIIPQRARMRDWRPADSIDPTRDLAQPERSTFRDAEARVTGFVICPGGEVLARIYDKSAELQLSGREEKREIENAVWTKNGWDGSAQVTRVEFQLRGSVLDEMRLRDPTELPKHLDAIWSYLTSRVVERGTTWLRLSAPESATRKARCDLDPRWAVVQSVRFVHERSPLRRLRVRGGATWPQALGATLSALSGRSLLGRVDLDDFVRELAGVPERARGDFARQWGTSLLVDVYLSAAMASADMFFGAARGVTDQLQNPDAPTGLRNPSDVARDLGERVNASWARFRSVDDEWIDPIVQRANPEPRMGDHPDDLAPHWTVVPEGEGFRLQLVASTGRVPRPPDRYDDDERQALEDSS